MILPGRDVPWRSFVRTFVGDFINDHLVDYAGSIAFSAILSIFPFLLCAVALASVVIDPKTLAAIVEQVRRVAPAQAATVIVEHLDAMVSNARHTLVTFSGLGALWAASGTVGALTAAFNTAYDAVETRPYWKTRGMAILITVVAAIFFVVASAVAIATPAFANALGPLLGTLVLWLRVPVAALIMVAIVASLYHFLPDVKNDFRLITTGSVTAVVAWVLASMGFSAYVSHFGRYEIVYGTLGSAIVLLLWIWISALVILAGAEMNAVLDRLYHESKARESTPPLNAASTGDHPTGTTSRRARSRVGSGMLSAVVTSRISRRSSRSSLGRSHSRARRVR